MKKDKIERCNLCNQELNTGNPLSVNCGGDCRLCMALAGDPDCIKQLKRQGLWK